jgi:hypothetical protein
LKYGIVTLLSTNTPSQIEGIDVNFDLPNVEGYFQITLDVGDGGGISTASLTFDNVRWERYPLIDTSEGPWIEHVQSGDDFVIKVDYYSGFTCTVTDTSSGIIYSTTETSSGVYKTESISLSLSDSEISRTIDFTTTCNGLTSQDNFWKLKINKDNLMSYNSGFDQNGTIPSTFLNFVGTNEGLVKDWDVIVDGPSSNSKLEIPENNSLGLRRQTDGNHYIKLTSSGSTSTSNKSAEIRAKESINGGIIYFDVNSYSHVGGRGFRVYWYPDTGGSTLLYQKNTSFSDTDINITIPDVFGKLGFSVSYDNAGGNNVLILDNIRYYSPKTSSNDKCNQLIRKGDVAKKIDLVFSGSGFEDQNQFESVIKFVLDYDSDENGIFSFEPFRSNKDKFNIWYVDNYKTYDLWQPFLSSNWVLEDSALYDQTSFCPFGNEFILLSVEPRFRSYAYVDTGPFGAFGYTGNGTRFSYVNLGCEILGTCPFPGDLNELNPSDPLCQGDGNFSFCTSIDSNSPAEKQRLVAHEFGHSFGGLFDEYSYDKTTTNSPGNLANCTDDYMCTDWNASYSGIECKPICGYTNWYKPYVTSLMFSHLWNRYEFKEVNEERLSNVLSNYPTATFADSLSSFFSYLMSYSVTEGEFTLNSVSLVPGLSAEQVEPENFTYYLKGVDENQNTMYDLNFNLLDSLLFEPLVTLDTNGQEILTPPEVPVETFTDGNYVVRIPYFPELETIYIYDVNDNLKLSVDTFQASHNFSSVLGFGGGEVSNENYTMLYSLVDQPTKELTSNNYKVQLGWTVYGDV